MSIMMRATLGIFGLPLLIGILSATKHPRILGGDNAKIQFFPYQVSLRYFGMHKCGGSIISNRHILTAAHCIRDNEDNKFLTIHSGTNRSDKLGNVHQVESIHIHPEWVDNEESDDFNDIAVITLKDSIDFNKHQNKVNLPNDDIQDFQIAHLTGWGFVKNFHNEVPKILQKIRVEVMTSDTCKSLIDHKIIKKQICAFKAFGIGPCQGDSGGPLVSKGEIVGIVSYANTDMCAAGQPDVYTNVFAYKDFIESVMNK